MSAYGGPEISDSGLVLSLDAANPKSYLGYGTTWTDLTGGGSNGTLTNGPAFSFQNGGALVFDGTDDSVNFGDILDMGTNSVTINAWVKPTASFPSDRLIVSKARAAVQNYRYSLGVTSSLKPVVFVQGNGGADVYPNTTNSLSLNTWHMVTAVYNRASDVEIYINGVKETLIGSATISQWNNLNFQSNNPYRVGAYTSADNITATSVFIGNISTVQHYTRALTAAEILQMYNATRGRYIDLPFLPSDISGLQLWLDASEAKSLFSDTAGTTLATTDGTSIALWKDKSGNSRNLAQSTSGNRPVLKKAVVNSLDGIRFDGTNDYLDYATNIRPSAYSVFVVVNKTTTSSVTFCGASDTAGNGHARYFEISSGFYATNDIGIITGNGTDNYRGLYTQNSAGNLIVNNTPTVLSMTSSVTGSGTTLELFKNNSAPATNVIGANITSVAAVNRNFAVGRLGDYNGSYLQGDIYEILIYNSALTTTQRQQVESYLNTKWKVY